MARKEPYDLSPLRPISTVTLTHAASLAWGVGTTAYCGLLAIFVAANDGTVPPWTFRGMAIGVLVTLTSAIMYDLYTHEAERQCEDGSEQDDHRRDRRWLLLNRSRFHFTDLIEHRHIRSGLSRNRAFICI